MVNKSDIKAAMSGEKVSECSKMTLEKKMIDLCVNYCFDSGHKMDATDRLVLADRWADSIKHPFGFLFINEIDLAMKWAGQGHMGDTGWPSIQEFNKHIRKYIELNERKAILVNNDLLQLPEKAPWSEGERIDAMRGRYRENLERVRNGTLVKDLGGLLFDHMATLGFVEICQEDEAEMVEDLKAKLKANSMDTYSRDLLKRHRAGEKCLIPYVQEKVLRKYFEMEIEAQK